MSETQAPGERYTFGVMRYDLPRVEVLGIEFAYGRSLEQPEHGMYPLGYLESPYDPNTPGGGLQAFTLNNVAYEGSIYVKLDTRGGRNSYFVTFDRIHRAGNYRAGISDAAAHKLETALTPLLPELFPMPTADHLAYLDYETARREIASGISSAVHSLRMQFHGLGGGNVDAIRAGITAAIEESSNVAADFRI